MAVLFTKLRSRSTFHGVKKVKYLRFSVDVIREVNSAFTNSLEHGHLVVIRCVVCTWLVVAMGLSEGDGWCMKIFLWCITGLRAYTYKKGMPGKREEGSTIVHEGGNADEHFID